MPSAVNVHVDPLLTSIAIGYRNPQFIADQIAATVAVSDQSGKYAKLGQESWRVRKDEATPRSDIAEVDWEGSLGTYVCGGHALRHFVPNLINQSNPFDELQQATDLVMDLILLNREKAVYDWVTNASNVTNSDSPSTKWDGTTPKILKYLETRRLAVMKRCGRKPNCLLVGPDVWPVLMSDTDLLDRIRYTQTGLLTVDSFGGLADLKIQIAPAIYDSANEGQSVTGALAWPAETAVLYYQSPNANMWTPDSFKLFNWTKAGQGVQVRRIPDEQKGTHGGIWVEATQYYDIRTTCNESAERLTDLLT